MQKSLESIAMPIVSSAQSHFWQVEALSGVLYFHVLRWLYQQNWEWTIQAKSDLQVTLAKGSAHSLEHLLPPTQHAHLFHEVTVLGEIKGHLATANGLSLERPEPSFCITKASGVRIRIRTQ